jgi:hypothetical protein
VKQVRFHRSLYAGEAVDEAVKAFAAFGAFDLVEEAEHWVVRVTARDPAEERQLVGELANYALGTSLKNLESKGS